jgi:hypothetical protein
MKLQFDASLVAPAARDTFTHIKANWRPFVLIFLASTAAGIGMDLSPALGEAALLYVFAFLFFNLFLQACIVITVLNSGGQDVPSRKWRIASLFGAGLITGLGIAFGLLLLVLPGLFFAGRWFVAAPALFAEDISVSEAIQASWDATEQHWLACSIIAVVIFLCQGMPLAASLYLVPEGDITRIGTLVVTNALSQAAWVFGIAASATMYLAIGRRAARSAEIFG